MISLQLYDEVHSKLYIFAVITSCLLDLPLVLSCSYLHIISYARWSLFHFVDDHHDCDGHFHYDGDDVLLLQDDDVPHLNEESSFELD